MQIPTKTLLMIRARAQAADFVADLSLPNPVIFAPMVRIDALHTDTAIPDTDMIIFTSSNAVRHFAARSQDCLARVLCVGSVTAQAATTLGFKVSDRFETANAMVAYIEKTMKAGTSLLYPRAETISLDIKAALSGKQIIVRDLILYRQTFLPLSTQAKIAIESSTLITPVLSVEIAKRFRDAVISLKVYDLTIICISAQVAAIFDDSSGFRVETAQKPTRAALKARIARQLSA